MYSYERHHETDSNLRIESDLFLRINFVNNNRFPTLLLDTSYKLSIPKLSAAAAPSQESTATPAQSSTETEAKYYDNEYFDSDSDDEGTREGRSCIILNFTISKSLIFSVANARYRVIKA